MGNILHVQQNDWETLKTSAKPVLVDFWAEWCSPCRMLGPTLERLAEQYGNEITFAKVNVDEMPDLSNQFGIRSIPTLVLLRGGNVLEKIIGVQSQQELARVLDRYVTAAGSQ